MPGMNATEPSEKYLVSAIRKGDEASFESLYMKYAAPLRKYSEMIVKDPDSAYEVIQDTFVSVWMNRRRLDPDRPVRNYLLRAVHNNSLRFLRKENARRMREFYSAPDEDAVYQEEAENPGYDTGNLIPAVDKLPEQSRKVFIMSYLEEMKNMDIASELSISVRTVESILYKTRKRLRDKLKKF